jgi:hypothetical protein
MWWSFLAFFVGVLCGRSVWFMRRMRSMNVAEARANARAAAQATATGVVIIGDGLGAVDGGGVAGVSGVLGSPGARGALVSGREVIEVDWSEADERVTA